MTGFGTRASLLALALSLAACNQTGGVSSTAAMTMAQYDPTGLSGTAIGLSQSLPQGSQGTPGADYSKFAPRLRDVAAGNTARPSLIGYLDSTMGEMQAAQTAGFASSVAGAAISGAMTGGTSLIASAPTLAVQAAGTGAMTARMAAAQAQTKASLAQMEAERAAARIVPDADRPAEAQAILSIVDDASGGSAAWSNPETGSSGRVTIRLMNKADASGAPVCRAVRQEWRNGKRAKTGTMTVCQSNGDWYDMS
jgi:hypothetical protein